MRPSHRFFASCLALAVVTAPALRSYAADPVADEALTKKAAALYDEGVAAYRKSKWAAARASFLASWALKKHWQIAGNLGDCELKLGLYRDAAEHLSFFLRTMPQPTEEAEKLLQQAREKTSRLAIRVDTDGADVL